MSQYILRDLPPDLWTRFKERVNRDGWHLRALFLQLMKEYGDGSLQLRGVPSSRPDKGMLPLPCAPGHSVHLAKLEAAEVAARGTVWCQHCGRDVVLPEDDRATLQSWAHTPSEPKSGAPVPVGPKRVPLEPLNDTSANRQALLNQMDDGPKVLHTAVIKLNDGDETKRIRGVALVDEQEQHLVLRGARGEPLGRVSWRDIQSWFLEDS